MGTHLMREYLVTILILKSLLYFDVNMIQKFLHLPLFWTIFFNVTF